MILHRENGQAQISPDPETIPVISNIRKKSAEEDIPHDTHETSTRQRSRVANRGKFYSNDSVPR